LGAVDNLHMSRRKKIHHEREMAKSAQFRVSLESESGYSSCSSVMSRQLELNEQLSLQSRKLLHDHNYGALLSFAQTPVTRFEENLKNYTDHVEQLKVTDDEDENRNHVAKEPAKEIVLTVDNKVRNRRKSVHIEPPQNMPLRKSRRLSIYAEKLCNKKFNNDDDKREDLKDFPSNAPGAIKKSCEKNVTYNKLELPPRDLSDHIEPLKTPTTAVAQMRPRRKSHCIETIFNIDKKKITRRKSVYVEIFASRDNEVVREN
jgi:hypothetical protein